MWTENLWLARDADHVHLRSDEVKNGWSYTSILPYAFMAFAWTALHLPLSVLFHFTCSSSK